MFKPPKFVSPKVHAGPIKSSVAGRTDHLPIHVRSGSYVIPADVVSHHGEGNSSAGFKALSIFRAPNRTKGAPYGEGGLPYGAPPPEKADGGAVDDDVPIVAAGGELVLSPEDVTHVAGMFGGDLDDGHKLFDQFVLQSRADHIKALKGLPAPRKD